MEERRKHPRHRYRRFYVGKRDGMWFRAIEISVAGLPAATDGRIKD